MRTTARPEPPSAEALSTCVHCGLCLEACPTYRELRVEMDSPRGRIYLMKGILAGHLEPTPTVLEHLDRCLDCRACESACPSGVPYGHIVEQTRTVLESSRPRSWVARLSRWFLFRVILPSRVAQRVSFKLLWLLQALHVTALGQWLGRRRLLPRPWASAVAQAPSIPWRSFRAAHARAYHSDHGGLHFPARGQARFRVALFTGCLADQLFASVNEATVRVLAENGCDVDVLALETCCGALHIHNAAREQAKELAQANVRAFSATRYDAIVSNAAGCSAELKAYGELLAGDPAATAFGAKVKDITEWLHEIGAKPPSGRIEATVAYAEPCHLLHAQKISAAPKAILQAIPGLKLVPLPNAEFCCGSAGIYSFLQPALSEAILARKLDDIRRAGASMITTGNPGCLLQIRSGLRAAGMTNDVVHPIELLARAYEDGSAT